MNDSALENIIVKGARMHNLKDVDITIPRNKLVVITGVSGSGKSSLAFDTIYAEGQRRYLETFSSYARQFIGSMERPDVESIDGLSPVISIEQKTTGRNPRSTVGTITEIYDFLRLLFARVGNAYSYETGLKMVKWNDDQIIDHILENFKGKKTVILAPLVRGRKGHYRELFEQMRKMGYMRVRIDGEIIEMTPGMALDRYKIHDIELVVDRVIIHTDKKDRIVQAINSAMSMGKGLIFVLDLETNDLKTYSKFLMCPESGISYEEPSPNTFSFNSPYGLCKNCHGLGTVYEGDLKKIIPDNSKSINQEGIAPLGKPRVNNLFNILKIYAKEKDFSFATPIKDLPKDVIDALMNGVPDFKFTQKYRRFDRDNILEIGLINLLKKWYKDTGSERNRKWAEDFLTLKDCPVCHGYRIKKEAQFFKLNGQHIGQLAQLDLNDLYENVNAIEETLTARQKLIATDILKEIKLRISFLLNVGLEYLTLNRSARTLSGGEGQRIRLASQIGAQLTGITYILDEPSIGLHQRDNQRLIRSLRQLSDIGNSVLVVEHDKDIMLASDYLIDIGPSAGKFGGKIVGEGTPETFLKNDTITAAYLNNSISIPVPKKRRKGNGLSIKITKASGNNLQDVTLKLPLGKFICVTGVSGSGKSTLINATLYPILRQHIYRSIKDPMPYDKITGIDNVDKVIEIDQSAIGRTPRSNPATYTGMFTEIRNIFAKLPESKIRGYKPGVFSFNVKGGRCETCRGAGKKTIEMNFLPDIEVDCDECLGRRYNSETLEILYKGKSINDVLEMSVDEAVPFFEKIPKIYRRVKILQEVGLGYIKLGQQATTLSGGEAQRVKLSEELSKRDTGNTLYILDEPTTGLHFEDIKLLLNVLNKLVDKGNTVLVIEHNLDVVKVADHIIDLGPEGGKGGGFIVAEGTPEKIIKANKGHTGRFLALEMS